MLQTSPFYKTFIPAVASFMLYFPVRKLGPYNESLRNENKFSLSLQSSILKDALWTGYVLYKRPADRAASTEYAMVPG